MNNCEMDSLLEKYTSLYDSDLVGHLTLNKQGIILEANRFFARLLGVDQALLLHRSVMDFVAYESGPALSSWLDTAVPGQDSTSFELILKSGNGSLFYTLAEGRIPVISDEYRLTVIDMTYRRQAGERMDSLTRKLRDLSAHIEAGMEQEKKRIAREIHDGLGSSLSALKMELSILHRRLDPENVNQEIENHIRSMSALVEGSVELIRKLATELRPEVLDELGLITTLGWYTSDFKTRTGIITGFSVYPKDFKLDPVISTAVFRIFQEIMNNITKHAGATKVTIFLHKRHHLFLMRVRDNGVGIKDEELEHKRSFGIIGMQERVKLLKGQIKITGVRNKGTTVVLEIPTLQTH